jgi:hypothetical protein
MIFYVLLTGLFISLSAITGHPIPTPNPTDVNAIRETIARYSISIDTKDYNELYTVFTDDVVGEWPPLGVVHGVPAIISAIGGGLINATCQHAEL